MVREEVVVRRLLLCRPASGTELHEQTTVTRYYMHYTTYICQHTSYDDDHPTGLYSVRLERLPIRHDTCIN